MLLVWLMLLLLVLLLQLLLLHWLHICILFLNLKKIAIFVILFLFNFFGFNEVGVETDRGYDCDAPKKESTAPKKCTHRTKFE
jgi:hypothetical protein